MQRDDSSWVPTLLAGQPCGQVVVLVANDVGSGHVGHVRADLLDGAEGQEVS